MKQPCQSKCSKVPTNGNISNSCFVLNCRYRGSKRICVLLGIYILWVLWVMSRQRAECVHFISFLSPAVLPKKHSEIHRIECSGLKISVWLGGKPRFVVFHAISDIIVQAMALIFSSKNCCFKISGRLQSTQVCLSGSSISLNAYPVFFLPV